MGEELKVPPQPCLFWSADYSNNGWAVLRDDVDQGTGAWCRGIAIPRNHSDWDKASLRRCAGAMREAMARVIIEEQAAPVAVADHAARVLTAVALHAFLTALAEEVKGA